MTKTDLAQAVKESGLSLPEFSQNLLSRHANTVRGWLNDSRSIPESVTQWITHWNSLDRQTRLSIQNILRPKPSLDDDARLLAEAARRIPAKKR